MIFPPPLLSTWRSSLTNSMKTKIKKALIITSLFCLTFAALPVSAAGTPGVIHVYGVTPNPNNIYGTGEKEIGKISFRAKNEDIQLNKITIRSEADLNLGRVKLYDEYNNLLGSAMWGDYGVTTEYPYVHIRDIGLKISRNSTRNISVRVNIPKGLSKGDIHLSVPSGAYLEAYGLQSGQPITRRYVSGVNLQADYYELTVKPIKPVLHIGPYVKPVYQKPVLQIKPMVSIKKPLVITKPLVINPEPMVVNVAWGNVDSGPYSPQPGGRDFTGLVITNRGSVDLLQTLKFEEEDEVTEEYDRFVSFSSSVQGNWDGLKIKFDPKDYNSQLSVMTRQGTLNVNARELLNKKRVAKNVLNGYELVFKLVEEEEWPVEAELQIQWGNVYLPPLENAPMPMAFHGNLQAEGVTMELAEELYFEGIDDVYWEQDNAIGWRSEIRDKSDGLKIKIRRDPSVHDNNPKLKISFGRQDFEREIDVKLLLERGRLFYAVPVDGQYYGQELEISVVEKVYASDSEDAEVS